MFIPIQKIYNHNNNIKKKNNNKKLYVMLKKIIHIYISSNILSLGSKFITHKKNI